MANKEKRASWWSKIFKKTDNQINHNFEDILSGILPIYISYSGSWEAFIPEEDVDWAFLEKTKGRGTGYLNLCYTTNKDIMRTLTIRMVFDSGETVDITTTSSNSRDFRDKLFTHS